MVPLVLALLVLMAGFFAAQTSLHHKQLNSSHAQAVEKSLLHMENRFADLTRLLGELQRVVMADVELVNLLKYQQRAQHNPNLPTSV